MGKDKNKLIKHISANTLQVLGNQCLGVFIFLLISRELDKPSFGELSWALAVLTLITTLLSLRLEQIVVRNVAAGDNPSGMLTLFAAHNFFAGLIFFGVLSLFCYLYPGLNRQYYLLWMLSISQILTFWALPFRQLLTGRSAFGWLALLASISNLVRATGLYICAVYFVLNVQTVVILFTISSLLELALGAWIVCGRLKVRLGIPHALAAYTSLLRSSLPQVGVVFLNAGIARIDWILLGFLSTPAHTAEYTFTYRAFEFAPLPLLVLAPFLLNRFARGSDPDEGSLHALVRMEMVFATLPVLWLVIMWSPVVDAFTENKYGQVNAITFLILACCIPFQYLVNLYWSHAFARNRLSHILSITAMTGAVVLAGDVLLIPVYAGQGAALAYLAAMIVQYVLYARNASLKGKKEWGRHLLLAMSVAACSGLTAVSLTDSLLLRLLIASALYCLLGWLTGLLKAKEMIMMGYKLN
ncbi:MAG: oligosaccharide flippase family protein [Chitinophagaceae bacterium]|nr:oligosaccharide flippase family protein [Chitinophagaceae bacterium]